MSFHRELLLGKLHAHFNFPFLFKTEYETFRKIDLVREKENLGAVSYLLFDYAYF